MLTPALTLHRRQDAQASRAFTLIELLTVIAIIGILAAILLPVVGRVRESAKSARCVSNLRQAGVAIQAYVQESKGILPATGFYGIAPYYNRDARNFQHSLLPYLSIQRSNTWSGDVTQFSYSPIFDCPSFKGAFNEKGYIAQEKFTPEGGTEIKPWGFVKNADGTGINPKPRPISEMPPKTWAIRDNDAKIDGVAVLAHSGARNTLFFEGNVQRVAIP